MLFTLRYRHGVCHDGLIEADDLPEADWRGRKLCDEQAWTFVYVKPAVLADKKSHPMPKAQAEKVTARVGA